MAKEERKVESEVAKGERKVESGQMNRKSKSVVEETKDGSEWLQGETVVL